MNAPESVTLPCTPQQVQQLAQAWGALQAAKERADLVFSCILAAHGMEGGALESFTGGAAPSVTVRPAETEPRVSTEPAAGSTIATERITAEHVTSVPPAV